MNDDAPNQSIGNIQYPNKTQEKNSPFNTSQLETQTQDVHQVGINQNKAVKHDEEHDKVLESDVLHQKHYIKQRKQTQDEPMKNEGYSPSNLNYAAQVETNSTKTKPNDIHVSKTDSNNHSSKPFDFGFKEPQSDVMDAFIFVAEVVIQKCQDMKVALRIFFLKNLELKADKLKDSKDLKKDVFDIFEKCFGDLTKNTLYPKAEILGIKLRCHFYLNQSSLKNVLQRLLKAIQIHFFESCQHKHQVDQNLFQRLAKLEAEIQQLLSQIDSKFMIMLERYQITTYDNLLAFIANSKHRLENPKIIQRINKQLKEIDAIESKGPLQLQVNDLFEERDFAGISEVKLKMCREILTLLETGNTIDGVIVANKLLKRRTNQAINNFQVTTSWKKRRCHWCLEYILQAGMSLICANISRQEKNSCQKLYCFNCIVKFQEIKNKMAPTDADEETPEMQRQYRQKVWFQACQNILWTCPCCNNRGRCYYQPTQHTLCNVQHLLTVNPTSFLYKNIYCPIQSGEIKFKLLKIMSYARHKNVFKCVSITDEQVEALLANANEKTISEKLDLNLQIHNVQLQDKKFFFEESIIHGTKLHGHVLKRKYELNLKPIIMKHISDFSQQDDFDILEKYKNYITKSGALNQFLQKYKGKDSQVLNKWKHFQAIRKCARTKEEENQTSEKKHSIAEDNSILAPLNDLFIIEKVQHEKTSKVIEESKKIQVQEEEKQINLKVEPPKKSALEINKSSLINEPQQIIELQEINDLPHDLVTPSQVKRFLPKRAAKENAQNQLQWLHGSRTLPVMNVLNVEELEDIDKQINRQLNHLEQIQKEINYASFAIEQNRVKRKIEKNISLLCKQREDIIEKQNSNSKSPPKSLISNTNNRVEEPVIPQNDDRAKKVINQSASSEREGGTINVKLLGFEKNKIQYHIRFPKKQKDKDYFFLTFKHRDSKNVIQHKTFMRNFAETCPSLLANVFIYVKLHDSNIWKRAKILKFEPNTELFLIQNQNNAMNNEEIKLHEPATLQKKNNKTISNSNLIVHDFILDFNLRKNNPEFNNDDQIKAIIRTQNYCQEKGYLLKNVVRKFIKMGLLSAPNQVEAPANQMEGQSSEPNVIKKQKTEEEQDIDTNISPLEAKNEEGNAQLSGYLFKKYVSVLENLSLNEIEKQQKLKNKPNKDLEQQIFEKPLTTLKIATPLNLQQKTPLLPKFRECEIAKHDWIINTQKMPLKQRIKQEDGESQHKEQTFFINYLHERALPDPELEYDTSNVKRVKQLKESYINLIRRQQAQPQIMQQQQFMAQAWNMGQHHPQAPMPQQNDQQTLLEQLMLQQQFLGQMYAHPQQAMFQINQFAPQQLMQGHPMFLQQQQQFHQQQMANAQNNNQMQGPVSGQIKNPFIIQKSAQQIPQKQQEPSAPAQKLSLMQKLFHTKQIEIPQPPQVEIQAQPVEEEKPEQIEAQVEDQVMQVENPERDNSKQSSRLSSSSSVTISEKESKPQSDSPPENEQKKEEENLPKLPKLPRHFVNQHQEINRHLQVPQSYFLNQFEPQQFNNMPYKPPYVMQSQSGLNDITTQEMLRASQMIEDIKHSMDEEQAVFNMQLNKMSEQERIQFQSFLFAREYNRNYVKLDQNHLMDKDSQPSTFVRRYNVKQKNKENAKQNEKKATKEDPQVNKEVNQPPSAQEQHQSEQEAAADAVNSNIQEGQGAQQQQQVLGEQIHGSFSDSLGTNDNPHDLFIKANQQDINNTDLRAKMNKFYSHYLKRGFRECQCVVCKQMEFPVLIRNDADENSLVVEHAKFCELVNVEKGKTTLNIQGNQEQNNVPVFKDQPKTPPPSLDAMAHREGQVPPMIQNPQDQALYQINYVNQQMQELQIPIGFDQNQLLDNRLSSMLGKFNLKKIIYEKEFQDMELTRKQYLIVKAQIQNQQKRLHMSWGAKDQAIRINELNKLQSDLTLLQKEIDYFDLRLRSTYADLLHLQNLMSQSYAECLMNPDQEQMQFQQEPQLFQQFHQQQQQENQQYMNFQQQQQFVAAANQQQLQYQPNQTWIQQQQKQDEVPNYQGNDHDRMFEVPQGPKQTEQVQVEINQLESNQVEYEEVKPNDQQSAIQPSVNMTMATPHTQIKFTSSQDQTQLDNSDVKSLSKKTKNNTKKNQQPQETENEAIKPSATKITVVEDLSSYLPSYMKKTIKIVTPPPEPAQIEEGHNQTDLASDKVASVEQVTLTDGV